MGGAGGESRELAGVGGGSGTGTGGTGSGGGGAGGGKGRDEGAAGAGVLLFLRRLLPDPLMSFCGPAARGLRLPRLHACFAYAIDSMAHCPNPLKQDGAFARSPHLHR